MAETTGKTSSTKDPQLPVGKWNPTCTDPDYETSQDPGPFILSEVVKETGPRPTEFAAAKLVYGPPDEVAPGEEIPFGALIKIDPRPSGEWLGTQVTMLVRHEKEDTWEVIPPKGERFVHDDPSATRFKSQLIYTSTGPGEDLPEYRDYRGPLYFLLQDIKFPETEGKPKLGKFDVKFEVWVTMNNYDGWPEDEWFAYDDLWPKLTTLKRPGPHGYLMGTLENMSTEVKAGAQRTNLINDTDLDLTKKLLAEKAKREELHQEQLRALAAERAWNKEQGWPYA